MTYVVCRSAAPRALLVGFLVALTGCATFTGREYGFVHEVEVSPNPIDAMVTVLEPEIIDQDGDFAELVPIFGPDLRQREVNAIVKSGTLTRCTTEARDGNYTLSTKVTVSDYRAPRGGLVLMLLGGLLAPPGFGMAWSFPVSYGNFEGSILWELRTPSGELVLQRQGELGSSEGRLWIDGFQHFLETLPAAVDPTRDGGTAGAAKVALSAAPGMSQATLGLSGKKVAVLPLRSKGTAEPKIVEVVDTIIIGALQNAMGNGVELIGKGDIDAVLGFERAKDLVSCTDVTCTVELAGALGVNTIVAGDLSALGSKYVLSLTWIRQSDAKILSRHNEALGTDIETFDVGAARAAAALVAAAAAP